MRKKIKKNYKNLKKWMDLESNKFKVLGSFFLILEFTAILANGFSDRYDVFYWFCNHTPLIFAFAFFFRKKNVIKALINVGFIAQFLWTLDFLSKLIFNVYIFKVTRYVFEDIHGIYVLIPILIHVLSTNMAFYFTYKKKPTLKILFYSLVYLIFLYAMTLTYTDPARNINCVYEICGTTQLTFASYTYFWPIIVFFGIVIPSHGIQYLFYLYSRRKRKKNIN
ncbi:MAG: hypothetical protein PF569_06600 [Candidatus Woesearchaeota archaeon]|jgi:hypothetical protein|nr:hypothetical protein [Candidatus Woesearchaeota archaeon]